MNNVLKCIRLCVIINPDKVNKIIHLVFSKLSKTLSFTLKKKRKKCMVRCRLKTNHNQRPRESLQIHSEIFLNKSCNSGVSIAWRLRNKIRLMYRPISSLLPRWTDRVSRHPIGARVLGTNFSQRRMRRAAIIPHFRGHSWSRQVLTATRADLLSQESFGLTLMLAIQSLFLWSGIFY